jgi:hypothetical protein
MEGRRNRTTGSWEKVLSEKLTASQAVQPLNWNGVCKNCNPRRRFREINTFGSPVIFLYYPNSTRSQSARGQVMQSIKISLPGFRVPHQKERENTEEENRE